MNRSKQLRLGYSVIGTVMLALVTPRAMALDACDNCDIQALAAEYKELSEKSIELAEEASGKFGDAADAYDSALGDAKALADGLTPSLDPMALCGAVGDVYGKVETAMTALSGLWKLGTASGAEKEAAEIMARSNWYWKEALKAKKCMQECCKGKATPPPLVQQNPDVDFKRPVDHAELRQCLERLPEGDRKSLLADANAGKLQGTMHADNIAAIKTLIASSGSLK